ncbi:MAG TPA: DUF4097 family beta strand repeat-containing protein, partial [Oceanipulchritudo sp.]|nr:DUF4097 family beta strand repeat-containing protein [Oceanipulchritudo sp.]
MKFSKQTFFLFAGLAASGLTTVSADTFIRERTETFPASPGKSLRIDAGSAQLEVRPGAADVIVLNVLMHARTSSEEKAAKVFDSAVVSFENDATSTSLKIDTAKSSWFCSFKTPRPNITVIAECPPSTDLNFDTGSGDILVEGITGDIRLDTGSGSISGRDLEGSVAADTGSGLISVINLRGDFSGDTGSGKIHVENLIGSFSGDTGSGSIAAEGSIPSFEADTGSGSIAIRSNAILDANSIADTGSGSVSIVLPAAAAFVLDASTGSGSISCSFPD